MPMMQTFHASSLCDKPPGRSPRPSAGYSEMEVQAEKKDMRMRVCMRGCVRVCACVRGAENGETENKARRKAG